MATELLDLIPEVIIVGNAEMLFVGAAFALGMPKMARKALKRRYNSTDTETDSDANSKK